jgi:hypothetical protein
MIVQCNLILVHTPGYQNVGDFQQIAEAVHRLAQDIEVFIVSNTISNSVTRRRAGNRPSLIFSPGHLLEFRPLRGKVYAGSPIPKLEQIVRLEAAGLPVPASAEIAPGIVLPEAKFGSHVVVKPGFSHTCNSNSRSRMEACSRSRGRRPSLIGADLIGAARKNGRKLSVLKTSMNIMRGRTPRSRKRTNRISEAWNLPVLLPVSRRAARPRPILMPRT